MKNLAVVFSVVVFAIMAVITWIEWPDEDVSLLNIGNFIVLSLTLMVLVWYTYDNNRIARATAERWIREGVLATTYSMDLLAGKENLGKTMFRLTNSSPLIVRAKVNCNFRLYGNPVEADAPYVGKETWVLYPQQMSQGWFEIDSLLRTKGKNIDAMISECNSENRKHQFTMFLELEFWDELGQKRKLPGRSHYFDFERWAWIPQLTESVKS